MKTPHKKGNITVEISIMFPILCIVVMSFVLYMHGIAIQIGMAIAAREGARIHATTYIDAEALDKTQEVLDCFLIDKTTITIVKPSIHAGTDHGIIITRPYPINIPFVGKQDIVLKRAFLFHGESLEN